MNIWFLIRGQWYGWYKWHYEIIQMKMIGITLSFDYGVYIRPKKTWFFRANCQTNVAFKKACPCVKDSNEVCI